MPRGLFPVSIDKSTIEETNNKDFYVFTVDGDYPAAFLWEQRSKIGSLTLSARYETHRKITTMKNWNS